MKLTNQMPVLMGQIQIMLWLPETALFKNTGSNQFRPVITPRLRSTDCYVFETVLILF